MIPGRELEGKGLGEETTSENFSVGLWKLFQKKMMGYKTFQVAVNVYLQYHFVKNYFKKQNMNV